jgi:hypothetical protein
MSAPTHSILRSHYIKNSRFSRFSLDLWSREVGAEVVRVVRLKARVKVLYKGGHKPQPKRKAVHA